MEPFKEKLSAGLVHCIAGHLDKHLPNSNSTTFVDSVLARLDQLELKQRSQLIADQLHHVLPNSLEDRYTVLRAMLHPTGRGLSDQGSDEHGICGWGIMPLTALVAQNGLDDFEASLQLLQEMSTRFTAELDVRYFLIADQPRALRIMEEWLTHPDEQVRRLVSEGTRPRLPWAMQLPALIADPLPALPLLTALRDDPSEYVRRSVANHLNDIAKDHPDLVAELTHEWMQGADKNRERLLRHGCRTLIKQGHAQALSAFGLQPPNIELQQLSIQTPEISLG